MKNYLCGKKILLSIDPSAIYNKGHNFIYQESIANTAIKYDLDFLALVPIENKELLPKNFEKFNVLSIIRGRRKSYKFKLNIIRFFDLYNFKKTIFRAINLLIKKHKIEAIIIDGANIFQELILIFFLKKYKIQTILIKREEVKGGLIFRIIYKFQAYIFRYGKIVTDSEILNIQLKKYFNRVYTLPIPHTDECIDSKKVSRKNNIKIIWPGEPRPEKGLAIVKKIVNYLQENLSTSVTLKIPNISNIRVTHKNSNIEIFFENQSREEYLYSLINSDIVLLPYDCRKYQGRTSGIFVEAIYIKKIPLVSSGTWMSSELASYNLSELIVNNWEIDAQNIINKIISISNNENIYKKIEYMSSQYKIIHSKLNYINQLGNIISN